MRFLLLAVLAFTAGCLPPGLWPEIKKPPAPIVKPPGLVRCLNEHLSPNVPAWQKRVRPNEVYVIVYGETVCGESLVYPDYKKPGPMTRGRLSAICTFAFPERDIELVIYKPPVMVMHEWNNQAN